MKRHYAQIRRSSPQRGQVFIAIVIFIAMFLLAALGLATDYAQIWAHRQMAQGAADAACQAGAADLFVNAVDPSASGQNGLQSFSWIGGSGFDCSTNTSSPPCRYASLNGYSGSNVSVTFPSTLSGVPSISSFGTIATPYIQVSIADPVPLSFSKMVSSVGTFTI